MLTIGMHVLINLQSMLETWIKVEFCPVSALDPEALGARAYAMIAELAAISAEPTRLVRLFLTPEHRRAADLVASWMQRAGLAVSEDALGTLRGRFGTSRRRLLIGSHIDTVIDAGKYDGPLGVIAGILAAEPFAKRQGQAAVRHRRAGVRRRGGLALSRHHDLVVGLRRRVRDTRR